MVMMINDDCCCNGGVCSTLYVDTKFNYLFNVREARCYDFERFRLFAAVILASRLRSSLVETKECL